MRRVWVAPGVCDWEDDEIVEPEDRPDRAEIAELEAATWAALWKQDDRWAS